MSWNDAQECCFLPRTPGGESELRGLCYSIDAALGPGPLTLPGLIVGFHHRQLGW